MFSRRFHRLPVNLDAQLITEKENLPCVIDNISEGGLHIWITTAAALIDLSTGSFVKLEFQIPQSETLESLGRGVSLTCEIIWVGKRTSDGLTGLGLRVTDGDLLYQNFVRSLYMKRVGIL